MVPRKFTSRFPKKRRNNSKVQNKDIYEVKQSINLEGIVQSCRQSRVNYNVIAPIDISTMMSPTNESSYSKKIFRNSHRGNLKNYKYINHRKIESPKNGDIIDQLTRRDGSAEI